MSFWILALLDNNHTAAQEVQMLQLSRPFVIYRMKCCSHLSRRTPDSLGNVCAKSISEVPPFCGACLSLLLRKGSAILSGNPWEAAQLGPSKSRIAGMQGGIVWERHGQKRGYRKARREVKCGGQKMKPPEARLVAIENFRRRPYLATENFATIPYFDPNNSTMRDKTFK